MMVVGAGIRKSQRHQKIIGLFGEALVANWLSRSGYEVSVVDHVGIDIITYSRDTRERLGISVKSRTRIPGTERSSVNLFSENDRKKIIGACEAFGSTPWLAVYVEALYYADLFMTSLDAYERKYRSAKGRAIAAWRMSPKHVELYRQDEDVKHIHIDFRRSGWLGAASPSRRFSRQQMIRALESLPEVATMDEALEALYVLAKIEVALDDADAGRLIPHEEVVNYFREKHGIPLDD